MLCASGFEFEEKLHLAMLEQENARRALQPVSGSSENSAKRLDDAVERYNKRLSDFVNHKRACSLCKESEIGRSWLSSKTANTMVALERRPKLKI
jgi:hypothetical protein